MRAKSLEQQLICLAAEAVSQTPEAFMLNAALAEAQRVLASQSVQLHQAGEVEAARRVEETESLISKSEQIHEGSVVSASAFS